MISITESTFSSWLNFTHVNLSEITQFTKAQGLMAFALFYWLEATGLPKAILLEPEECEGGWAGKATSVGILKR